MSAVYPPLAMMAPRNRSLSRGVPNYVMPLVFGFAPLVNVLVTVITHPPKESPNPLLYLGYVLASAGAGLVLYFKPA